MKIEMRTEWLRIIEPGTYETELGEIKGNISEEYLDDFEKQLCVEAVSIMNEIFSEDWFVERFGNIVASNGKLFSPKYYNYVNNIIDFDLEINEPRKLIVDYYMRFEAWDTEEFFKWAQKNYGGYDGFISCYPYTYESFENALLSKQKTPRYDYECAIGMLLTFAIYKSKCALDSYQRDLEDNVREYCYLNGFFEDDEEDYEYE